jgi:hypothetical protein
VARAVGDGVIKSHLPFVRTAKGGGHRLDREFEAFWEAVIGGLLVVSAVVVVATNTQQIHEIYVFAVVLVLQSLPFLSAVTIAAIDDTKFNDFVYWRRLEGRIAEFLPHRNTLIKASSPAEKHIEPRP